MICGFLERSPVSGHAWRAPATLCGTILMMLALPASASQWGPGSSSGTFSCGTELSVDGAERHLEREERGDYRIAFDARPDLLHVRTALHIVRTDDGLGGLSDVRLDAAIQKANEDLEPSGITLVPVGPVDYIDSDAFYYEIDTTEEIDRLRSTNSVEGAMNIYFTGNLANENGPICGISSFTWSPWQGVVIDNDCAPSSWNPSTFTHELGHYFDLLHTHETAYGLECVDGSNCAIAGDRICDTPADPRLNRCGLGGNEYCVDYDCGYTGDFLDSCHGNPFDPSTTNMMSYSRPTCRDEFTPEQSLKAMATLVNLRPDHLLNPAAIGSPTEIGGEERVVELQGPIPNPGAGDFLFRLRLGGEAAVRMRICDASGRVVAMLLDGRLDAGIHLVRWNPPANAPSAVFFLDLDVGGGRESRMIVRSR